MTAALEAGRTGVPCVKPECSRESAKAVVFTCEDLRNLQSSSGPRDVSKDLERAVEDNIFQVVAPMCSQEEISQSNHSCEPPALFRAHSGTPSTTSVLCLRRSGWKATAGWSLDPNPGDSLQWPGV